MPQTALARCSVRKRSGMARLLPLCLFSLFVRFSTQEKTYLITAPKLLRLDASEHVVVQLFGYEEETLVDLYLKSTLAKGYKEFAVQTLRLNAQNKYQAKATLRIIPKDFPAEDTHVYLEAISPGFIAHKKIPVSRVNGFLFLQTDKPLYTPDQKVKVRVYSLNEELRKSRRSVTLTFMDPNGVKLEMIDIGDINGVKPLLPPFKLPLKPTFGIWKIKATYSDTFETTATAEFEVKEYVLPSISVHIQPEANYIHAENFETFKLKISAKYVYGTPVSSADVYLQFGYSPPEKPLGVIIPSTFKKYKMKDGQLEVILDIQSALSSMPEGPQHLNEMSEETFLRVTVLVQESTGGISQEAVLSSVKFIESPFTLSLIATPLFIKPGLPYAIRVLVRDPLGEPVQGVTVQAQGKWTNTANEENDIKFLGHQDSVSETSQRDGIAYFIYNVPNDAKVAKIIFETVSDSWKQAELELNAESYVSVNHRYLYINLPHGTGAYTVGEYINVNVIFQYRDYLSLKTFSYQIISRGKVVIFDTVKRISETTQSLNIQITHEMVPSARLLVYYVLDDGSKAELVADSVWIDVKAKCLQNLKVDISTLDKLERYKPKDELNLKIEATNQEESLVTLSAIDKAIYVLRSNEKDPLKKVVHHVEKNDLGCGGGGGKDNTDVFDRAGLMFLTNANARSSTGGACSAQVRPKRSGELKDKFADIAKRYGSYKKCCDLGLNSLPTLETCDDRKHRLKADDKCKRAFLECCWMAVRERQKQNQDRIILSRAAIHFLMDTTQSQIRSYFPESWLWEEHASRSGSVTVSRKLPDSLTTWELKAVGVFSNGICATEAEIQVSQDISIDVPLPYSMVRGEQIELRGSVYNQRSSNTWFDVTLIATPGICVFRGAQQQKDGKARGIQGEVDGQSVALVKFYIMALEAGVHNLTFTLTTKWNGESVVKKLKVVPEGVRKELISGVKIDPNGVYGDSIRKIELKNVMPPNTVPKSTMDRSLTVTGEVLGKVLSILNSPDGIKQLTNLPRGSAEMEVMSLLPVYYVYHYLESTKSWNILGKEASADEQSLRRKMQAGLLSIMSFKLKLEHGFSMWSNDEKTGSTWVTALIIKTLAESHRYLSLEPTLLVNTVHWLIKNCQETDGSFTEKSPIKPHKLMGAGADVTEHTIYLTSFIVIGIESALKVPGANLKVFKEAMDRALKYLFSNTEKMQSLYTKAIASYAMTLVDIHSMPGVRLYEAVKRQAQIKGSPASVRFWGEDRSVQDPLKPSGATAKSVETTAYVLLNTLHRGDLEYARPILNWLTQDQRYGGGLHSTQDSILTLEALMKYSVLASGATLDMTVNVQYKTAGDIGQIRLTQHKPVARPLDVTRDEHIVLKTAMSSGVAFAKLRTVYYGMSESNALCHFDVSVDIHDSDPESTDPMLLSQRIVACAKYKPHENAIERESGLTVMEINMPTGVSPVQEDLEMYLNGLESRISNYEVDGDKIILQIDSIPSDEMYCVGFRIQEEFVTGMNSASVFKVYGVYTPENACTKYYYKESRRLLKLCDGDQCQCMAAECCIFTSTIDPTVTVQQRIKEACKEQTRHVFKVLIQSSEAEGDFVTYKARVEAVLKKEQTDDVKTHSEIYLVKKATCDSATFLVDRQYLVMTAQRMQVQVDVGYRYRFLLDSQARTEWWPLDSDCRDSNCNQFVSVLKDFEDEYLFNGCGE